MNRHILRSSLRELKKRGLYIILALFICMGVYKPVKVRAVTPQLTISAISFRSNTETNSAGSVINDQRWLVYSFDFDDYYTGTFQTTIRINKASGYVVNYLVEGAQSSQTRQITSGNGLDTYADTFTFNITDCKHFTIIYSMQYGVLSGLGYTVGSLDNLVGSSGGSGSGVVDYTQYLDGLETSLNDAVRYLDDIGATLEPLAITVSQIKNTIDSLSSDIEDIDQLLNTIGLNLSTFFNIYYRYNMPYYTQNFYWLLQRNGYVVEGTYNNLFKSLFGWYMNPPTTYPSSSYTFTLSSNRSYLFVFASNDQVASVMSLSNSSGTITKTVNFTNVSPTIFNRTYKYAIINDITTTTSFRITNLTHADYILPIYFGLYDSAPEEVVTLINRPSNNNLLQKIVELFERNNQQNDELNGLVSQIQQQQQTVSGTIGGIETDINTNLNDVPLVETNTQLQNMSNVFAFNNNIFAQLWNVLGKITIVLVLYMILVLVRLFVKRE